MRSPAQARLPFAAARPHDRAAFQRSKGRPRIRVEFKALGVADTVFVESDGFREATLLLKPNRQIDQRIRAKRLTSASGNSVAESCFIWHSMVANYFPGAAGFGSIRIFTCAAVKTASTSPTTGTLARTVYSPGLFISNRSASEIDWSIVSFGFNSLVSIAEPPSKRVFPFSVMEGACRPAAHLHVVACRALPFFDANRRFGLIDQRQFHIFGGIREGSQNETFEGPPRETTQSRVVILLFRHLRLGDDAAGRSGSGSAHGTRGNEVSGEETANTGCLPGMFTAATIVYRSA